MCPPMNIRQGGIWVQARYEGDRLQGGNPVRSPYQGAQQGAILIAQPAGRKSSALTTYCVGKTEACICTAFIARSLCDLMPHNIILTYVYTALWRPQLLQWSTAESCYQC